MARTRRSRQDQDSNHWIGYTDLLSNSLLILLLTVAVTALARASSEKPPLLRLTEEGSFRFDSGSYLLSPVFAQSLDRRIPEIRDTIAKYRIDSVEVIGHTDGQPSPGRSNLDLLLPKASRSSALQGYHAGSNTDLGLLRAVAVANYLRLKLDPTGSRGLAIRPYSAGSLISNDGEYLPADTRDRADRRRIEVRFTRREER
jgi:outer membrane protein OmpA-like peptidoglycan-associated protein